MVVFVLFISMYVFFFKQKTAYEMRISDWSSDVCSSDLGLPLMRGPQMPSYHLVRDNHKGITLINIGVGPSNAKTITDHVAVLRPSAWLMLGERKSVV